MLLQCSTVRRRQARYKGEAALAVPVDSIIDNTIIMAAPIQLYSVATPNGQKVYALARAVCFVCDSDSNLVNLDRSASL